MSPDDEKKIVEVLRRVADQRGITLKEISKRIGISYSSLQNYFYKGTRMPLGTYLDICRVISVPPGYPFEDRFKIAHHALQQALIDWLGPLLNVAKLDKDSRLTWEIDPPRDAAHARRIAGFLAAMINARYDQILELELLKSDDEPDEVRQ